MRPGHPEPLAELDRRLDVAALEQGVLIRREANDLRRPGLIAQHGRCEYQGGGSPGMRERGLHRDPRTRRQPDQRRRFKADSIHEADEVVDERARSRG